MTIAKLRERVAELEASLKRAQDAEREQRKRAAVAEDSARRVWRISAWPAESGNPTARVRQLKRRAGGTR